MLWCLVLDGMDILRSFFQEPFIEILSWGPCFRSLGKYISDIAQMMMSFEEDQGRLKILIFFRS